MNGSDEFCGRVTIRLPKDKLQVYQDFKEFVTEEQHSDVCYVIATLMESYLAATKPIPNPDDPIILRMVKQNIQINQGCTFHYNVKKAKRIPQDKQSIETNINHILPNLVDMWQTLKPEAQRFWTKTFQDAGIIPQQPVTKVIHKPNIFKRLIDWLRRKLQWKQRGKN